MILKVVVEDSIYIENENGDQLLCLEMDDDMSDVLQELEKLVECLNKESKH